MLSYDQPANFKAKMSQTPKGDFFQKKKNTHYNKMNEPLILSTIKYIQDSSENSPNLVE